MKILILTIMMVALSSCVSVPPEAKPNPCKAMGGGMFRYDYEDTYCIKSLSYKFNFNAGFGNGANIKQTGLQCFEKKS